MVSATSNARNEGTNDDGGGRRVVASDVGPRAYRHMVRLRLVSARLIALQRAGQVTFHASSIGEEAAIVGAALAADDADWIFPGVREWGAALVRGFPLESYLQHAFGSAGDPAQGHAAPDHPPARSLRIGPVSGVPGAHLPQATGLSWAAKLRGDRDVAVIALFGEASLASGDVHNALNFAGVHRTPTVFVCRRDGRAAARVQDVAERALAYGVASAHVTSADVLEVHAVVAEARRRALEGRGPCLVDVASGAIGDVPGHASPALFGLGDGDPLVVLRRALERSGAFDAAATQRFVDEERAALDLAVARATHAPAPALPTLFENVFAEVPRHLEDQHAELRATRAGSARKDDARG